MIGIAVRDAVAVVAALAGGAVLVAVGDATGPVPGLVPWQVDVAIGVPACFALLLRRRWPIGLAAAVVPLSAVSVMATGAVLGAVFGLALRSRLAVAAGFAAGCLATTPVYLLLQRDAPGLPVEIVIGGAPGDGLRIEVSNPAPAGAAGATVPGSGLGLVGVAERVELAGGRLAHGTAGGRFRLEVRLPWLA